MLGDLPLKDFDIKICDMSKGNYQRTKRHEDKTLFVSTNFIEFQGPDNVKWRESLPSRPYSVGFYKKDDIWIGLKNNGVKIYNFKGKFVRSFLEKKSVTDLFIDHAEGIWITTEHSGVYYIQNPLITKKQFNNDYDHEIRGITHIPDNGIYLDYENRSVMKYTKGNITVHNLNHRYSTHILGYHPYFKAFIELLRDRKNMIGYLKIGNEQEFNPPKEIPFSYKGGIDKLVDDAIEKEIIFAGRGGLWHFNENFELRHYKKEIEIMKKKKKKNQY